MALVNMMPPVTPGGTPAVPPTAAGYPHPLGPYATPPATATNPIPPGGVGGPAWHLPGGFIDPLPALRAAAALPHPGVTTIPGAYGNGYGMTLGQAIVHHLTRMGGGLGPPGIGGGPTPNPPLQDGPIPNSGLPYGFPYSMIDYMRGAY